MGRASRTKRERKEERAEQLRSQRARLYRLQRAAQQLLQDDENHKDIVFCGRAPHSTPSRPSDEAYIYRKGGHAYLTGLQHCGSPWGCAVCAAALAAKRTAELEAMVAAHIWRGGSVGMRTVTFSHRQGEPLDQLLDRFERARKLFRDGKAAKAFRAACVGLVNVSESTYGINGHHPHFHSLVLYEFGVDPAAVEREILPGLKDRWAVCCAKARLGAPSAERGVTLQDGSAAASYLLRGSLAAEVAGALTKSGHAVESASGRVYKHCTPMELLGRYVDDNDERAGQLFGEYVKATKGRKQLSCTPGLKREAARWIEDHEQHCQALVDAGDPRSMQYRCGYFIGLTDQKREEDETLDADEPELVAAVSGVSPNPADPDPTAATSMPSDLELLWRAGMRAHVLSMVEAELALEDAARAVDGLLQRLRVEWLRRYRL